METKTRIISQIANLRLGTKEYQKPAHLPVCVPVLDFAENKLKNAENFVEPVRYDDTFIYSDTLLSVCGIPIPKKGFSFRPQQRFRIKNYQIFENRIKNQESIDWIRNRLNCKKLYWRKTGRPIFEFKNYLVSYIHSIDPNFQANDIDEVLYDGRVSDSAAALIYTNKSEAANKIERILQDRNVSEMFPGFKHLIS